jgi:hypothetical protein
MSGVSVLPWLRVEGQRGQPVLRVQPAAEEALLQKENEELQQSPVNLVCIFGSARQGKSFLMNLLMGTDAVESFPISNADTPCTQGVDISTLFLPLSDYAAIDGAADDPLPPESSSIRVGFVDAEGQGDHDVTYDTMLVSPVLLASKVVIFNW